MGNYLELRQCRPRLERLKLLLSECPYRGSEYEGVDMGEGCGITRSELAGSVTIASSEEKQKSLGQESRKVKKRTNIYAACIITCDIFQQE